MICSLGNFYKAFKLVVIAKSNLDILFLFLLLFLDCGISQLFKSRFDETRFQSCGRLYWLACLFMSLHIVVHLLLPVNSRLTLAQHLLSEDVSGVDDDILLNSFQIWPTFNSFPFFQKPFVNFGLFF